MEHVFRVVQTGAAVGAEIEGVDLAAPVPDDVKAALRRAWADHMVLLVRGQRLTDEQLLEASGIFGPPHDSAARHYHLAAGHGVDDSFMVSRHPSITIISQPPPVCGAASAAWAVGEHNKAAASIEKSNRMA